MSSRANPTAIGAFVVGAVVLAIIGIIVLGGGRFFEDSETYVMYFDGSVSGLRIGAPVEFRGVKVGEVRDIIGTVDDDLVIQIPVFVEIGGDRVRPIGKGAGGAIATDQAIPLLIQRGMRAQLVLRSFVTGQFYVELDFHSDTPARFVGDGVHREIPTIPSAMAELASRIQKIPIDEIAESALGALNAIEELVSSDEVGGAIGSLRTTLREMSALASQLEESLPELVESAGEAFAMLGEDSPLRYQLENSLSEFSAAARSIRVFADYLAQHPEALLTGKRGGYGD